MRIINLFRVACCSLLLAAQVTDRQLLEANSANWLHYNGSYDSRRHSALDQVNLSTINGLVPKWIFHVPGASRLQAVPVVVDGVMYVTQPNEVYALDARSGRKIWDYRRVPAREKGPNRGVAVWADKVYFSIFSIIRGPSKADGKGALETQPERCNIFD